MKIAKLNFIYIIIYFLVAWLYPWSEIQVNSTISISYLWDLVFVIFSSILLKVTPKFSLNKTILIRLPIVALLGTICIYISNYLELAAPFKYIENIFLQILILAPIIEEFIFRYSIFELINKNQLPEKFQLLIGSLLFSLSHAHAIWFLPTEFHSFIYLQLCYTFVLGWIVTKARMNSGGILEPVILHFVFNLLFYISVLKGWL